MPVYGPLASRRKVILIGLESTRGTAVVPAIPIKAFDPVHDPTAPFIERKPISAGGGHDVGVVGERTAKISFRAELRGNGNAGAADLDAGIAAALLACGWQKSAGVYKRQPACTSQQTATLYTYEDGRLKAACGCAGTARLEGAPGQLCSFTFDFEGVWIAPTTAALPSPAHNSTVPPRFAGAAVTVTKGSDVYSPRFSRFALNLNNKLAALRDPEPAAGVLCYSVPEWDPQCEFDAEAVLAAVADVWAEWLAGTPGALAIQVGSAAGNRIDIDAPVFQYRSIAGGDRDGLQLDNLTGQCCVSSAPGDELTITPS